jgi:hypothetical protein
MKTKTNASTEAPAPAAEASANVSVDQLAAMLKSRRPSPATSTPPSPASDANPPQQTAATAPSTEQTDAGEQPPSENPAEAAPPAQPLAAEATPPPDPESTEDAAPENPEPESTLDEDELAAAGEAQDEHAVRALQKRVSKVVKQRNDEKLLREHAERQVIELRQQIDQAKTNGQAQQPHLGAHPEDMYSDNPDIRQINDALANVEAVLNWTDENPDGAENVNGVDYDAARVRQIRAQAVRRQNALIARREARIVQIDQDYASARGKSLEQAKTAYPWLNNRASTEYQEATAILQRLPGIMADPDYPMIIGDYFRGRAARQAAARKSPATLSAKPKPATTPTPVVTASASTAVKVNSKQKELQAAEDEFAETGSMETYKKVLKLKQQLRQAA